MNLNNIKRKLWEAKEGMIIGGISWLGGYYLYTKYFGYVTQTISTYSIVGDVQVYVTQNSVWLTGLLLFIIIGAIIDLNKKRMPKIIREIFKW